MENLKLQLTCQRCLKTYAFPEGSLDFTHTPWQYRVVGPYSIPNFAEGAYSTVLTLAFFARRLGSNPRKLTYATGLDFRIDTDDPFEVDFTFWYQRGRVFGRDEEPRLVFGEAKSFAAESFKGDDVARMRKLAEKFPGAFIVFAAMKEGFSEAETRQIGEFALWGREVMPNGQPRTPVIVLTGTELFCSWDLHHTWTEAGGHRAALVQSRTLRPDNLWVLAALTQQAYLGLPNAGSRPRQRAPATPASPPQASER